MPPKVQSASSKGQTSLFSFFNKPPAAVAVVEAEPATTPAKSEVRTIFVNLLKVMINYF